MATGIEGRREEVKQRHTDRLTHSPLGSYCVATRIDRDSYHVVRERECVWEGRERTEDWREKEVEKLSHTYTHTHALY